MQMLLLQSLALILLVSHDAVAAPASSSFQTGNRKSFKVPRVRRNGYIPHGPTALRKIYQRYGLVDHEMTLNSDDLLDMDIPVMKRTESEFGSVSAVKSQDGSEFVAPVSIGGQIISLDFDTGSSDM